MGSSGTNRFTDYPSYKDNSGKTGGSEPKNKCEKAIGNIKLEDVENCEYYRENKDVPNIGDYVLLRQTLYSGRLVIQNETGTVIGLLPTEYNYLRRCIEQGYSYEGTIITSGVKPLPFITIDLAPASE